MLSNSHNNYSAVDDVLESNQPDLENYGIDEDGDVPELQTLNNWSSRLSTRFGSYSKFNRAIPSLIHLKKSWKNS